MENQDFYNFFAGNGMTTAQNPANIVQNVNMENELGIKQKPPKLMNLDEYAGWSGRFKNWVQANHFECWMKIEKKYVPPIDVLGLEKGIGSLTQTEQDDFKAEKKMKSILQQAIKEDILVLLQHEDNAQSMWHSLQLKFQGSMSMIKSKKALIKKEFDIFTGMKGETTKQLIERYCHLVVEMKRLAITKTNEEWTDKLADALPYDEWGTYLMMLKNNSDFVNLNLSSFIEKIEAHELELIKIKKMNSVNVQQDVSLYYKGSTPATTNLSPKIQTGFSADTTSGASSSTPINNKPSPFVSYEPNFKASEQPSPQSSSSSDNQAYVSRIQPIIKKKKRGRKATPKVQIEEGSSSQPKKRQKKAAKTLLIDEPDEEEPVANVEENQDSDMDEVLKNIDYELESEKVADEGVGADKGDKSSSSSSDEEIDEIEREKRIQAEIAKEKQLRKRRREEKEDDVYIPSPEEVIESQTPPSGGRKKTGARKRVVTPKMKKTLKILLNKKPTQEPSKPPSPPSEPSTPKSPHPSPPKSPQQSPPRQPSPIRSPPHLSPPHIHMFHHHMNNLSLHLKKFSKHHHPLNHKYN
ncbi:myb-like protein V [Helianthus annuus]|uniref:myb-like protein V n=1 Tax=Helianthus annuus TaxID=4232 RepID=UPI000B90108C|nr:myb-like protein V [Helianthus annuus]